MGGPSYHTHRFQANLDAVMCCVAVCYHKVYGCLAVGPFVCDCPRRIPPSESARLAFLHFCESGRERERERLWMKLGVWMLPEQHRSSGEAWGLDVANSKWETWKLWVWGSRLEVRGFFEGCVSGSRFKV